MSARTSRYARRRLHYRMFVLCSAVFSLTLLIGLTRADIEGAPPKIKVENNTPPPVTLPPNTTQPEKAPPPPKPPIPIAVPDDAMIDEEFDSAELQPYEIDLNPKPPAPVAEEEEEFEAPFIIVEKYPEIIGGMEGLYSRLSYPQMALQAGIEGQVIVQFVVDEQGQVTDAVVLKGIGGGCDEAALKAIQASTFEPGRQRGRVVKVRMSIPIQFRIR